MAKDVEIGSRMSLTTKLANKLLLLVNMAENIEVGIDRGDKQIKKMYKS